MQYVARLYLQRDGKEMIKNKNVHLFEYDENDIDIKRTICESKIMLINNSLETVEDFALLYMNLHCFLRILTDDDYQHVFINLQFNSSLEKQKWLETYPFKSFFCENTSLHYSNNLVINRREIFLPYELDNDETKNYVTDSLLCNKIKFKKLEFDENKRYELEKCFSQKKGTDLWLLDYKAIRCLSYFLQFWINEHYRNIFYNYRFISKYNKHDIIDEKSIVLSYYCKTLTFYIIRYKEKIHLKEFSANNDLLKISTDIIVAKDEEMLSKTIFKYIAHSSDIDSYYMPVYVLSKYQNELLDYEKKFNNFCRC